MSLIINTVQAPRIPAPSPSTGRDSLDTAQHHGIKTQAILIIQSKTSPGIHVTLAANLYNATTIF